MKAKILGSLVLGLVVSSAWGCGGVGVERSGADPLRILAVSPRMGETGVPSDADVVVVFSARMILGGNADVGELNTATFQVLDAGGTAVVGELSLPDLDQGSATAVFHPSAALGAGRHEVVLSADLVGQTDDGPTEPLGVEIRSSFEVGP